ncbi:MAG: hypothetical protein ABI785_03905 [Gemmatimonadales bacterium]
MHRARCLRLKAFLLLAVFLSAGTSLPSLDAVVYHSAVHPDRSQIHIEPAGGCLSHADHCGLARTASGSGAVATLHSAIRVQPVTRPAPPCPQRPQPTPADRSATSQPRAPPSFRSV